MDRITKDLRREIDKLIVKIDSLTLADIQDFTEGQEDTFLREDGTFAEAGLRHGAILKRISLR